MEPDFSGWATKNDLKCKDGRIIKKDAFKHNDKMRVPLVWQHQHNEPENVLGHAILENRAFGVYTYGFFNDTPKARASKMAVKHGDITGLSIYANNLAQQGPNVMHGDIKEVSLVLAGANPGAVIDNLYIRHSDGDFEENESEAVIWTGLRLSHSADSSDDDEFDEDDEDIDDEDFEDDDDDDDDIEHSEEGSKETLGDVYKSLDKKQKDLLHFLVGQAVEGATSKDASDKLEQSDSDKDALAHNNDNKEGSNKMGRNVFEQKEGASLTHKLTLDQISTIMHDANRIGSLKESFLAHAGEYGIDDIDFLFPDAKTLSDKPEILSRRVEWVEKVLGSVKRSPISRIKSIVADLTAAEARAKGYIKGTEKAEEVIGLLKRTTTPTTVYKKQKLDRDDILDITEIDIIAWLKWEIRYMLEEELARAILVGDGRSAMHADKIKDPAGSLDGSGIRSIVNDHEMYAHPILLAANVSAKNRIEGISRARRFYRGSGTPTLYIADSTLTDMLHIEDKIGRRLYETEASLASALRVKEIVTVEVLEEYPSLVGIVVNLVDYTVGSNKGGELSFFEDFDIDFNQEKYLMETRVSGGLTKPKAALVISRELGTAATPLAPSFDGGTSTITIPTVTGIIYMIDDAPVTGDVVITVSTEVVAIADTDYYIPNGTITSWNYTP